jgi:hypothetical protein
MKSWIIAFLLVLGACSPERGVRFQHASHSTTGIACTKCHEGITTKTGPDKSHLPKDSQCARCHRKPHKGKKYPGTCAGCHSGVPHEDQVVDARRHLRFNHQTHLGRNRGQCFPCHSATAGKVGAHQSLLPPMSTCLTCHQKSWDKMECGLCHESLTVYPLRPVSQFSHAGDFLRSHGKMAASRADMCAQCHTQAYCVTCHDPSAAKLKPSIRWPEAVQKSFIHRGDYVGRHAVEARSAGDQCLRCHAQRECRACHESRGVSQGSGRSQHPPGWVSVARGSNTHGPAARREIVSCAGCHDRGPASNCVRCHRVGGVGGNPHPPGWRSRLSKEKDRMCRVCH